MHERELLSQDRERRKPRVQGEKRQDIVKPGRKLRFESDEIAEWDDKTETFKKSSLGNGSEKTERQPNTAKVNLDRSAPKWTEKSADYSRVGFDDVRQKPDGKILTKENVKPVKAGMIRSIPRKLAAAGRYAVHEKVDESEEENAGLEAGHRGEQGVESLLNHNSNRKYSKRARNYRNARRMEKRSMRAGFNSYYARYKEKNPGEKDKKALNRFFQKQRIKREYQKTYMAVNPMSFVRMPAQTVLKAVLNIKLFVVRHKAGVVTGALVIMLLFFLMASLSSCIGMFTNVVATTMYGCWLSEPEEIDAVELAFTNKEVELQETIDSVEQRYPDYDEYRYNLDSIAHNPFSLISYFSAKYESFTFDSVSGEMSRVFDEMYTFTTEEIVETRTKTKTRTVTDPITGETSTKEVDVDYDYYILNIKLKAKSIEAIAATNLTQEQLEIYAAYMESKGGLQQLGTPLNLYWYNYVSSYYGYRQNPISGDRQLHRGLDIAVPEGTEVVACYNGTVVRAAYDSYYGNYVVIEDQKGYTTKYAHLSAIAVVDGQQVVQGGKIGETGNTGSSTGSHLHMEVLFDGVYYNPLFYLDVGEGTIYGEPAGMGGNVQPPAFYDDATVQRLMQEAERYLGMPYTFGGTPPSSFDCSAFVCWVFTNSGVRNLPRTTAQGIYDQCVPVSVAQAKAGDLIFFTGTYNAGRPVTHIGIYCGNGVMIHCGDPIQYASINTSYWQSHFYGFGRLD